MEHLEKPSMDALEVLISSKENIRSKDLKQKIEASKDFFSRRYNYYDRNASLGRYDVLFNCNNDKVITRVDQKDNMKLLYSKMTQEDTDVREYYKKLRRMTTKCPYCSFGKVTTLDHYLPKAIYPTYAVYPNNLIPSCRDCNSTKSTSTDITLHPYYDNVEGEQWLFCEFICKESVSFRYKVEQSAFSKSVNERISTHFSAFDLQTSFIGFASDEFNGYLHSINTYLRDNNIEGLKADINERYLSNMSFKINHWRTAFYQSLHYDTSWIEYLKKYL